MIIVENFVITSIRAAERMKDRRERWGDASGRATRLSVREVPSIVRRPPNLSLDNTTHYSGPRCGLDTDLHFTHFVAAFELSAAIYGPRLTKLNEMSGPIDRGKVRREQFL